MQLTIQYLPMFTVSKVSSARWNSIGLRKSQTDLYECLELKISSNANRKQNHALGFLLSVYTKTTASYFDFIWFFNLISNILVQSTMWDWFPHWELSVILRNEDHSDKTLWCENSSTSLRVSNQIFCNLVTKLTRSQRIKAQLCDIY